VEDLVRLLQQETYYNYHNTIYHVPTLCGDLSGKKIHGTA